MSLSPHSTQYIAVSSTTEASQISTISAPVIMSEGMDTLDIVTVLLAILGVIVLILCIVVAGLLIYQYCRLESEVIYMTKEIKSFQSSGS